MQKKFYLANNFDVKKGSKALLDLNEKLNQIGIKFKLENKNRLVINIDDDRIQYVIEASVKPHIGRPIEHSVDMNFWRNVALMQLTGKTATAIYKDLGMSKALFYIRKKERESTVKLYNVYNIEHELIASFVNESDANDYAKYLKSTKKIECFVELFEY